MIETQAPAFDSPGLVERLDILTDAELDELDFGVIGFDAGGVVRRYNTFESRAAGLSSPRVVGHALFTVVAPCMNNYLVAQRFEDTAAEGGTLDDPDLLLEAADRLAAAPAGPRSADAAGTLGCLLRARAAETS